MGVAGQSPALQRRALVLGVSSALLLAASFRWAHHWGVIADTLVATWALTTCLALVSSIRALKANPPSRGMARAGLTLTLFSVVALILAGLAFAAGGDPGGACGGG